MYTFRFAKDLDFETWEATNGFLQILHAVWCPVQAHHW